MELKQYEYIKKKKKPNGRKEKLLKERDDSMGIQSMKMLSLKSVRKRFIIKQSEKIATLVTKYLQHIQQKQN